MFWTLLFVSIIGVLLFNLGALSVLVALLLTALKAVLVIIVLLAGGLACRRKNF